jgi:hypothetical protein
MKLNPEELEVVSFDTEVQSYQVDDQITIDPNHPTPATHCFVCD